MSYKYCNITPNSRKHLTSEGKEIRNPLGSDRDYQSLGDKIRIMVETGEDIGEKINPVYDADDVNDVNIFTSYRHDAMDIAETFGKMPDVAPTPLPSDTQVEE